MNSLSLLLIFFINLILTKTPSPVLNKPEENPIQKIFKSKDVKLDRETLKPVEKIDIKDPETYKDRVLEVTTFLEGDLDPSDNIKVTTRIRDYKNEEITYITPSFEKIDGKLTYSHSVLQEENDGIFTLKGASKSDVNGEGNLGIHIQQFDTEKENDNRSLFGKYALFLKTYIEYLYKYNIDIRSEHLKDLENSFVYFGSLSNGENPSLESSYTNKFKKGKNSKDSVYETVNGSEGRNDSSISYGVSNELNDKGSHGFQNLVATASGENPLTGLQLKVLREDLYIKGSIVGQALAKANELNSMTTVDTVGNNSGLGFTDNTTYSKDGGELLATATEINNLSVAEEQTNGNHVIVLNAPSGLDGVGGNLSGVHQKNSLLINGQKNY